MQMDSAFQTLRFSLTLSEMALNEHYNLLWRIGFRNVVTVLFPFFLLLVMNLKIVSVIRTSQFELISSGKLSEMQRKVTASMPIGLRMTHGSLAPSEGGDEDAADDRFHLLVG